MESSFFNRKCLLEKVKESMREFYHLLLLKMVKFLNIMLPEMFFCTMALIEHG